MASHHRIGLTLLALSLLGCDREEKPTPLTCTAKLAAQEGSFTGKAVAEEKESRDAVEKRAVKSACAAYCGAQGGPLERCQPRCLVDIEAAKIGVRVSCSAAAPSE